MHELAIYKNDAFDVRTVQLDGEPWFVAKDVCTALDITRTDSALRALDDDEKGTHLVSTPGGRQKVSIVNEPGLYALIGQSRKPEAKAFRRWVNHEVLPAIRQTGGYIPVKADESEAEVIARAMGILQRTIEDQRRQLEAVQPKAEAFELLAEGKRGFDLRDVVGILHQDHGIDIGERALRQRLVRAKVLYRSDSEYRYYAKFARYFVYRISAHEIDGVMRTHKIVQMTPDGIAWLLRKLRKDAA